MSAKLYMNIVEKYRLDIFSKLLSLVGISLDNLPTVVTSDKLEDPAVIAQFKEYVPIMRKFYSSDKLTALHSNAFEKQKNPGLNLIRQLLREHDYEIKSRNERVSTNPSKQFVIYKLPMPESESESAPVPIPTDETKTESDEVAPPAEPEKQRIQLRVSLKKQDV